LLRLPIHDSEVEIVVLCAVLVLTVGVAAGLAKGLLTLVLRLIVDETASVA
jgi:ABC-type antimicrobial peptide transport system permease subunit